MYLLNPIYLVFLTVVGVSGIVIHIAADFDNAAEAPLKSTKQPLLAGSPSQEKHLSDLEDSPEMHPSSILTTTNCGTDSDILQWDSLTTDPSPPPGTGNVTIKLTGTLSEQLDDGAWVTFTVKFGLIQIFKKEFDLCAEEDISCPIPAGPVVLSDTWTLGQIPPGKFRLHVDAYTVNDDELFCADATVDYTNQPSDGMLGRKNDL